MPKIKPSALPSDLSISRAAEYLGLSVYSIRRLINSRTLETYRVGGRGSNGGEIRIKRESIEAFRNPPPHHPTAAEICANAARG